MIDKTVPPGEQLKKCIRESGMKKIVIVFLFLQALFYVTATVDSSGNFSYTYPVQLPAGTNGMQPQISLNYNC